MKLNNFKYEISIFILINIYNELTNENMKIIHLFLYIIKIEKNNIF